MGLGWTRGKYIPVARLRRPCRRRSSQGPPRHLTCKPSAVRPKTNTHLKVMVWYGLGQVGIGHTDTFQGVAGLSGTGPSAAGTPQTSYRDVFTACPVPLNPAAPGSPNMRPISSQAKPDSRRSATSKIKQVNANSTPASHSPLHARAVCRPGRRRRGGRPATAAAGR